MAEIRASDRERELVAAQLRDAVADGRLEPDEFEERLQLVYTARTRSRLAVLVEDLPALASRRPLPSFVVSRRAVHLATYAAATVLLVCFWMADVGARDPLIVGDSEFPWPAFPIILWGALLARSARRGRRPRSSSHSAKTPRAWKTSTYNRAW